VIYKASVSIASSLLSWATLALMAALAMSYAGWDSLTINLTKQWFYDVAYVLGITFAAFFVATIVIGIAGEAWKEFHVKSK
jgi:uncharacterized membrane protein YqjE